MFRSVWVIMQISTYLNYFMHRGLSMLNNCKKTCNTFLFVLMQVINSVIFMIISKG